MRRRLIIRPEAEADLTDAATWYDKREPGLGLELLSEVHSGIARALKNPESFIRVRRTPTVRRVLTRRFPFRVFFIDRRFNSSVCDSSRSSARSCLEVSCRTSARILDFRLAK